MENIIKDIIKNKKTCIFVSPHLDDAIFSAGGLMYDLFSKNIPIIVVNVFTNAGDGLNTFSARQYLKQCGAKEIGDLYQQRRSEDGKVLSSINTKIIDLHETDALWRKKTKTSKLIKGLGKLLPETYSLYPTYKFNIVKGNIHKDDEVLIKRLSKKIADLPKIKDAFVFCPLALGNHVDHRVVKNACERVVRKNKLIYWTDFPYSTEYKEDSPIMTEIYRTSNKLSYTFATKNKLTLCMGYTTQFDAVIRDKNTITNTEIYYQSKSDTDIKTIPTLTLKQHLDAIKDSPKGYVFNLLKSKNRIVLIKPFVKDTKLKANQLVEMIQKRISFSKTKLIGSTGLEIIGQGDVDIICGVPGHKMQTAAKGLDEIFGSYEHKNKYMFQWKVTFKGIQADVDLVDINSDRFKDQLYLFDLLNNNAEAKLDYQEFKNEYLYSSDRVYKVARMGFINQMYKKYLPIPKILDGYELIKSVGIDNFTGPYRFALYGKNIGTKSENLSFAKFYKGSKKSLSYTWLQNEINAYKLLTNLYQKALKRKDVGIEGIRIPKLVGSGEYQDLSYMMMEFVNGDTMENLDEIKKLNVFESVIKFFDSLSQYANRSDRFKITNREPARWLLILPLVVGRAILLNPKYIFLITSVYLKIIVNSFYLITRKKLVLSHRDFNDTNVIVTKDGLVALDFQLTCWADPLVDYAVLYVKYFNKPKMIASLGKSSQFKQALSDKGSKKVFEMYTKVFALYDLSLPDGYVKEAATILKEKFI